MHEYLFIILAYNKFISLIRKWNAIDFSQIHMSGLLLKRRINMMSVYLKKGDVMAPLSWRKKQTNAYPRKHRELLNHYSFVTKKKSTVKIVSCEICSHKTYQQQRHITIVLPWKKKNVPWKAYRARSIWTKYNHTAAYNHYYFLKR